MHKIGVDWGSSNFRAYLLNEDGAIVDCASYTTGVEGLSDHDFEQFLFGQLDPWLGQSDTIFLAGMVTSRIGWVETPYAICRTPVDRLIFLLQIPGSVMDMPSMV